jgi:multidrug efflux system outer membrane protein
MSSVADAYLALAADRENLRLAESTFAAQKESYDLLKRSYDIGVSSELDLNRVQIQMDIARVDMARYTQQVAKDINALNLLVGTVAQIPDNLLPENLASTASLQDISVGLSSDVLFSRPDIMQAEHRLKAANANIGAARSALFPRISLTTSIGTASSELSGLFGNGQDTWMFAPGITMPIFDARLWSALDVTRAEKEIAVAQYEKAIQTAFREVADALAVRGTVDQQISAQESLFRAAERTYRLSDMRYKKGIDSYLGVLDAQRTYYSAQQGLVALRLAKLINQVDFYKVLGGGSE